MSGVKTVAIFGSSSPKPASPEYLTAYELGKALAVAGYGLINGGYGGTMEATAKGAREAGGDPTVGVTCLAFGRKGPNPWIDKEIRTNTLNERLDTLIQNAQAYILLPGGTGTLLELAMVWELMNKHFLDKRPIICLANYWKPLIDLMVQSHQARQDDVQFAQSHTHVVKILTEYQGLKLS